MNVGDKVVCIHVEDNIEQVQAIHETFEFKGELPQLGKVYVVRELTDHTNGQNGVKLVGSTVIHKPTGLETGLARSCFRKLDEMRQEISQPQPEAFNAS